MQNLAVESQKLSIMPTSQVVEYFIKQQSEGTGRTYGSAIRAFFVKIGKDFRDVSPLDALGFDAHLKATCSPATVQRHISTLTRFFAFAMKLGIIQINPFAIVKQQHIPSNVANKFLTVSELDGLLSELARAGMREYVLGLLLSATGMRISEVQQLSWSSFIEAPDGGTSINVLRKGNIFQLLPLRDDVWQIVKIYMNREINQQDDSPLFLNPSKSRTTSVSLRTWIVTAAKKAGIKKNVTPHVLRHTFCSLLLANNADLRSVQWAMSHKSIITTERYAHPQNHKVGELMPLNLSESKEDLKR